jgi:GNAT superfamily N-acetyltransferase
VVSPAWQPAVGPVGTLKKEFPAHVDGAQVGRLLLYREADGRFDISGIGVRDTFQGRRVASQLLDYAFRETAPITSCCRPGPPAIKHNSCTRMARVVATAGESSSGR